MTVPLAIITGIPASGKSRISQILKDDGQLTTYDGDAIRHKLFYRLCPFLQDFGIIWDDYFWERIRLHNDVERALYLVMQEQFASTRHRPKGPILFEGLIAACPVFRKALIYAFNRSDIQVIPQLFYIRQSPEDNVATHIDRVARCRPHEAGHVDFAEAQKRIALLEKWLGSAPRVETSNYQDMLPKVREFLGIK